MAQERIDIVVTKSGDKEAAKAVADIGTSADKSSAQVDALTSSINFMKTALLTVGIGVGVSELIKGYTELSDTFTGIVNRLKLVSSSSAELVATEQALLNSANSTRASFEATANLYTKLAMNTSQLGIDQKDLIPNITTINQLIAISGATATEASAGLLQFSQGLASNRFQGDELRSVLENLPALGQAIAKGLNTTTAGLRTMGEQGQLSAKLILDALQKQAPEIAKQFAQITPTIGGAFQVLKNNVLQFVGTFDQVNNVSGRFAQVILFMANHLTLFVRSVETAAAAVAAFYVGLAVQTGWAAFSAGITAVVARITAANVVLGYAGLQLSLYQKALILLEAPLATIRAGFTALWAVIAANPITIVIGLLGAAAAAVYFFGDQVKITADGSINLWGAVAGSVQFLWTKLQGRGQFLVTVLGPTFTTIGNGISAAWTLVFNAVKAVIDTLVAFIPSLQPLSTALTNLGSNWVKAMQDASKATGDAGLAAKDFGKLGTDSMNAVGAAAAGMAGQVKLAGDGLTQLGRVVASAIPPFEDLVIEQQRFEAAQRRAKEQSDRYTASIKQQQEEIQRLALTTRNAMGDMITVTDEWARRSGAAFNAVKDGASSTASAVEGSMDQIINSANNASSAIQSTASNISAQSTYLNDSATVKGAFESQGGGNWAEIGNALLVFNNMYGHPGGDTAVQRLWNLLNAQPKAAAHSFVQNYAYVNTAFAGQGLPTFANGGSFSVGGTGGTDSQLVQFMASPDETVTVETPSQRRNRGDASPGQRPVIVNMNVQTPDANSFRRSKSQTYLALRSKLSGVQ